MGKTIKTFSSLHRALDILFQGISEFCRECSDDDCVGYVWLLPKEAEELYEQGIEVLEINNNVNFLHPFAGKNEGVDIEQYQPSCPWRKEKKCTIYSKRPLVCRFYPLGFATEHGTIYLVLHLDCPFSRQKSTDALFQNQIVMLFRRLHPQLLKEILGAYRLVDQISKFPEGPNNYLRLMALDKIKKEGGGAECRSARQFSTARR